MITVSHHAGRLAEIRMTAPLTADDMAAMQRGMAALLTRLPGRIVVCADLHAASVLPEDLADRMAKFFRSANTRIERAALVVGSGATFFMQVERLLRQGMPALATAPRAEGSPVREQPSSRSGQDAHAAKPPASDPHLSKRMSERRAFHATSDAIAWLDEILTGEERARLRLFLIQR